MVLRVTATHNRAGEITYRHLGGLKYEAVITTYTKTSASAADRPELEIRWGDGTNDTIPRESIEFFANDAQKNIYRGTHIYAGEGTFVISMEDPNRNEGVINIPSSVNVIFYIESVLTINNTSGHNNSVLLLNPPLSNSCIEKLYIHTTGAFDPNGDSLSFKLVECKGTDGLPIPGYTFPDQWPPGDDNNLWIDQESGSLFWDSPKIQGEYNIAILIEEWRTGVLVGSVIRDMQITVFACSNNPPVIEEIADTCVNAGETLIVTVAANDPDNNNLVLDAFGEPLDIGGNTGIFSQTTQGPPTAHGVFIWSPESDKIRSEPYVVTIQAKDTGGDVDLADFEAFKVIVANDCDAVVSVSNIGSDKISFELFPNPASDIVKLSFAEQNSVVRLKVYSLTGRQIMEETISKNQFVIDISKLMPGIYLIEVKNIDGQKLVKRLIVK
jgi:hypothetical protein